MADITTVTLDQALKRLYSTDEIINTVNLESPALGECFATGSATLGGGAGDGTATGGFTFPVRVESSEGHAYIDQAGNLPSGRQSVVRQAVVTPTVHAGVAQVTGLAKSVGSQDVMAFIRPFDEQVQQLIASMTAYKEGAAFRAGTGLLATFTADAGASAGPWSVDDVGFLREGLYVDVIATGGGTRHNLGVKIIAVDWVNRTVTFDTAIAAGATTGDELYIAEGQSQTNGQPIVTREPLGLEASLLATGTYLGIARATYANWQANVFTASAQLDEDILLRARTRLTQESGIGLGQMARRMKLLTHPTQVDIYFKLSVPRTRFAGANGNDVLNSSNGSAGGMPFVTSYQCPTSKAYLADWSSSQSLYTPGGELHVDTEYNGSALKWLATRDVGLMFLKEYCAFAFKRPNAAIRIISLTDATR